MTEYVALIHKDADSGYGVSFPDIPGVITGGDTIDEAMEEAEEVLTFAAEDWTNPDGSTEFPSPRSIDELRNDPEFIELSKDATVVMIEFRAPAAALE